MSERAKQPPLEIQGLFKMSLVSNLEIHPKALLQEIALQRQRSAPNGNAFGISTLLVHR